MDSKDLISRIEGELGSEGGRDAAAQLHPPPRVADHEIIRRIGAGSYGEVWLARNITGQWRAVKAVARDRFTSERPYEREFRGVVQFEPISRAHSGLVQVLHVGRDDAAGAFYYVMELADAEARQVGKWVSEKVGEDAGTPSSPAPFPTFSPAEYRPRTLRSDLKARGRLSVPEAVALGVALTGALGHIHRHGLVHRDVKPSNVIFVQGQPKLADLGLVTSTDEAKSFVGTEGFIPPEGPGTVKADLFALGRLLYEAVTGKDRCEFPELPSDLDSWPNREEFLEFNEVVTQLCAPDPERRYANAAEVAGDLNLILAGRSVRRANGIERRLAQAWRITAMTLVGLALAAGILWFQQARQRQAEARAAHERALRERAENAERDGQQQLHTALFEQARALVLSRELGHRTRALRALQQAAGATNRAAMRRVAFAALSVPDLRLEGEIPLDPRVTLLEPDPAFARVALCNGSGPVTICSLPGFELLATLSSGSSNHTYVAAWSGDGRFLAVKRQRDGAGVRSDWEIWNIGQTQHVFTVGPDVARNAIAFHPQGALFLAGHGKGRVTEWNVESGQMVREFHFPDTPHALAYSPDGRRVSAVHRMGARWTLAFLDAATFEVQRAMDWPEPSWLLRWHPRGNWITTAAEEASAHGRGVYLIDADTGAVTRLGEHKIKTAVSVFAGDGDYLVSSGWDREIFCWDLRTSQRMFTHAGTGYRHYWNADGQSCAVWLPENTLQLFSFERPAYLHLPDNPGDALRDGRFSPDGRWLVARDDRHLCVWDTRGRGPAAVLPIARRLTAFFSPDSTELFAVPEEYSQRGFLGRWQLAAGTNAGAAPETKPLPVYLPPGVLWAAVAGNELVVTSAEGARFVALTNLASGEGRTVRIPAGLGYVSPDGHWMAMVYEYSPWVTVYRLPAVEEVARLKTSNLVTFVTFSPTGDEMLVLNRGGAEWFDTATWKQTRRQPGAPVSGSYAFYTPDGNGIWMVTHFRNAALFDRRTLEPLLPLPDNVLPLTLSSDGQQLAVSVEGRRVQLWDIPALRQELARLGLDW